MNTAKAKATNIKPAFFIVHYLLSLSFGQLNPIDFNPSIIISSDTLV